MAHHLFRAARCWLLLCATVVTVGCADGFRKVSTQGLDVSAVPKQFLAAQVIVILAPAPPDRLPSITRKLGETYGLVQTGMFGLATMGVQCVVFQIPDQRSVDEVVKALASDPLVEWAQRNQLFQVLSVVYNDRYANLQYGPRLIRADLAHDWATGRGIKVAIIDTGIDARHPDLRGRVVKTANFVEGGEQTFSRDIHGTAVAGVIAATANNDIGIFGVAPEADILAVKACWQRSPDSPQAVCSSWALARAIDFSILQGARILNFSLAGPPDPLLARLIAKAIDRGIAIVAAAVDDGEGVPAFPVSLDSVIAVLATDMKGNFPFAARARRVPILAAPGIDILTTAPGDSYDFFSGSSLAAAHVSGIAALLLELDPTLPAARLHSLLHITARPLEAAGSASKTSVGLVDACAAIGKLLGLQACL